MVRKIKRTGLGAGSCLRRGEQLPDDPLHLGRAGAVRDLDITNTSTL